MNMKKNWSKKFSELLAGIAGGSNVGMLGLLFGAGYGSLYGCLPFIDAIFNTRGYEYCGAFIAGAFTAIIGMLLGAIIGVSIFKKFSKENKKSNIISLLVLFVLPFLLGFIFLDGFSVFTEVVRFLEMIFAFAVSTIIPAIIVTFLMNWKKFLTKSRR